MDDIILSNGRVINGDDLNRAVASVERYLSYVEFQDVYRDMFDYTLHIDGTEDDYYGFTATAGSHPGAAFWFHEARINLLKDGWQEWSTVPEPFLSQIEAKALMVKTEIAKALSLSLAEMDLEVVNG